MTKSKSLRIQMVAAVTAMLLVSLMVVRTSSAAFTDDVTGGTDTFSTSSVYFNDLGSAVFASGTGLLPGDVIQDCISVAYGGDEYDGLASVKMYVDSLSGTDGTADIATQLGLTTDSSTLLDYANLNVVVGDSGVDCATLESEVDGSLIGDTLDSTGLSNGTELYDGTLNSFNTSGGPLDTSWTPASDDTSRVFVFQVELPSGTGNQAQGDSASGDFTWSVSAGS